MDWHRIKEDGHLVIHGVERDVTHLRDITHHFRIEASGKYQAIEFNLLVQYSSHCVSWGPKRDQEINFEEHGQDRRVIDDKGVHRCFCDRRYELTQNLPGMFENFLDRTCLFTGKENWLTMELLDENGQKAEYEVYFSLTKQSSKHLRIYVESAYIRDQKGRQTRPVHFKRHEKIRARVLLAKKLRGERIKRPIR